MAKSKARKEENRILRTVGVGTAKGTYHGILILSKKGIYQVRIKAYELTEVKEESTETKSGIKKVLRIGASSVDFDDKPVDNKTLKANAKKIEIFLSVKGMNEKLALEDVPDETKPAKGILGAIGFKPEEVLSWKTKIEKELEIKVQKYFEEIPYLEDVPVIKLTTKTEQKIIATVDVHCNLTNKLIRQFVTNYINHKE